MAWPGRIPAGGRPTIFVVAGRREGHPAPSGPRPRLPLRAPCAGSVAWGAGRSVRRQYRKREPLGGPEARLLENRPNRNAGCPGRCTRDRESRSWECELRPLGSVGAQVEHGRPAGSACSTPSPWSLVAATAPPLGGPLQLPASSPLASRHASSLWGSTGPD